MNDLHLKPSDAIDCSKWREMTRQNWTDSNTDSDDTSWIWIVHFWCQVTRL